jgi:hypothetical protein
MKRAVVLFISSALPNVSGAQSDEFKVSLVLLFVVATNARSDEIRLLASTEKGARHLVLDVPLSLQLKGCSAVVAAPLGRIEYRAGSSSDLSWFVSACGASDELCCFHNAASTRANELAQGFTSHCRYEFSAFLQGVAPCFMSVREDDACGRLYQVVVQPRIAIDRGDNLAGEKLSFKQRTICSLEIFDVAPVAIIHISEPLDRADGFQLQRRDACHLLPTHWLLVCRPVPGAVVWMTALEFGPDGKPVIAEAAPGDIPVRKLLDLDAQLWTRLATILPCG